MAIYIGAKFLAILNHPLRPELSPTPVWQLPVGYQEPVDVVGDSDVILHVGPFRLCRNTTASPLMCVNEQSRSGARVIAGMWWSSLPQECGRDIFRDTCPEIAHFVPVPKCGRPVLIRVCGRFGVMAEGVGLAARGAAYGSRARDARFGRKGLLTRTNHRGVRRLVQCLTRQGFAPTTAYSLRYGAGGSKA